MHEHDILKYFCYLKYVRLVFDLIKLVIFKIEKYLKF